MQLAQSLAQPTEEAHAHTKAPLHAASRWPPEATGAAMGATGAAMEATGAQPLAPSDVGLDDARAEAEARMDAFFADGLEDDSAAGSPAAHRQEGAHAEPHEASPGVAREAADGAGAVAPHANQRKDVPKASRTPRAIRSAMRLFGGKKR